MMIARHRFILGVVSGLMILVGLSFVEADAQTHPAVADSSLATLTQDEIFARFSGLPPASCVYLYGFLGAKDGPQAGIARIHEDGRFSFREWAGGPKKNGGYSYVGDYKIELVFPEWNFVVLSSDSGQWFRLNLQSYHCPSTSQAGGVAVESEVRDGDSGAEAVETLPMPEVLKKAQDYTSGPPDGGPDITKVTDEEMLLREKDAIAQGRLNISGGKVQVFEFKDQFGYPSIGAVFRDQDGQVERVEQRHWRDFAMVQGYARQQGWNLDEKIPGMAAIGDMATPAAALVIRTGSQRYIVFREVDGHINLQLVPENAEALRRQRQNRP